MKLPLRRFAHNDSRWPVRAADDAEAEVVLRRGGTLIGHESYPLAVSKGSIV